MRHSEGGGGLAGLIIGPCPFCHRWIYSSSDWQFIAKRQAAHSACAFAEDEKFWEAHDQKHESLSAANQKAF